MRSSLVSLAILCASLPTTMSAAVRIPLASGAGRIRLDPRRLRASDVERGHGSDLGRVRSDPPSNQPQSASNQEHAAIDQRLRAVEQAVAAAPENLALGAEYRQMTIAAGLFDRAIDLFRRLAKANGSGPNVKINLALAYADKVPTSGDIRRLYLGRDAMNALTQSIEARPSVLAYYFRGQINLYYNRLIFHRTDKGVADLTQAVTMITRETPPTLVARVYAALGDGYFRLENLAKAREVWATGLAACPDDPGLKTRLDQHGQALLEIVTAALSAGRRSDTSLVGWLPSR